ncbi:hypothetical protein SAMN05216603_104249 [Pseudomonas benzenivorans]|nr:hypothetical protein SAMN05216603_104249 [Pseudomonas benzenivorans]
MPLFKLPFEEKRPITAPLDGHAQPDAERATGCTDVAAGATLIGAAGALCAGTGMA